MDAPLNLLECATCLERGPRGSTFYLALWIDGRPFPSGSGGQGALVADPLALDASLARSGEHYILTHISGWAAEAGLNRGIGVLHDAGELIWHCPKLIEGEFRFSLSATREAVEAALDSAEIMLTDHPEAVVLPRGSEIAYRARRQKAFENVGT